MDPTHDIATTIQLLNNNGVQLLESNQSNVSCAIHAFQNGMAAIKQLKLNHNHPSRSVTPNTEEINDVSSPLLWGAFSPLGFGRKIEGLQRERGSFYTFDRPLLLQPPPTESSSNGDQGEAATIESYLHHGVVATIFNLALAYQKYAFQCGSGEVIRRGIKMYYLAAIAVNDVISNRYTRGLLLSLNMNNAAILHNELCEYNQCEVALRYVRETLVYTQLFALYFIELAEVLNEIKLNITIGECPVAAQA